MRNLKFSLALAAGALLAATPATAQLFKCQDASGKVVFSDVRCEAPAPKAAAPTSAEKAAAGRYQMTDADRQRIQQLEAGQKRAGLSAELVSAENLEIFSIRSGQDARLSQDQRSRREALQPGLSSTDAKKRKEALNAIRELYSQQ